MSTALVDPLSAATAEDPYPYYERLLRERPFSWDERLHMWVAASAEAVTDALSSSALHVRPPSEPVPAGLIGTSLGDVFGCWARMTDGAKHDTVKNAAAAALHSLDSRELARVSERCADRSAGAFGPGARSLTDYASELPAFVLASLLGFPEKRARRVAAWTMNVVRALSPGAARGDVARGIAAADALSEAVAALAVDVNNPGSLMTAFAREGSRREIGTDAVVANAIGFVFQSADATAGLIGNTLLALANMPKAITGVASDGEMLGRVVAEVARHDAPVQNTRRFAAADVMILGSKVRVDDAILVLLAAANRDSSVNPDPHAFDADRKERHTFTFGTGPHACPGAQVSCAIAAAGVARVLRAGLDLGKVTTMGYRPSQNLRVPIFDRTSA